MVVRKISGEHQLDRAAAPAWVMAEAGQLPAATCRRCQFTWSSPNLLWVMTQAAEHTARDSRCTVAMSNAHG